MVFIVITSLISYFQTYIPVMVAHPGRTGDKDLSGILHHLRSGLSRNTTLGTFGSSLILFALIAALTALSFRASGGVKAGRRGNEKTKAPVPRVECCAACIKRHNHSPLSVDAGIVV